MADQTARLEAATLRAEIGSGILFRFSNDAVDGGAIPTQSGDIQNLKSVILGIQTDGANKISIATTIYPTTAAGIAGTANGAIFLVQSSATTEIYAVYQNSNGTAVDTGKRALDGSAITTATNSATQAAASAQSAADTATARVAGFHAPSSTDPTTRDDGSALQIGDTYFNTTTNSGRTYAASGWVLSSVSGTDLNTAISTREPTITAGTASQFWGGDKVFHDLNKTAVGLGSVDNTSDASKPVSTAQQSALNAKEPTIAAGSSGQYFDGTKTFKDLNKAAVGLGNVDNTSDVNKPISIASQAEFDKRLPVVGSIAAMRALTTGKGAFLLDVNGNTTGRRSLGGGPFDWAPNDTRADDGGTIIKLTSVTTGRMIRQLNGQAVQPQMWGALGDGAQDDTVAIQASVNFAQDNGGDWFLPAGQYKTTSTIIQTKRLRANGAGPKQAVITCSGGTAWRFTPPTPSFNTNMQWTNFGLIGSTHGLHLQLSAAVVGPPAQVCYVSDSLISLMYLNGTGGRGLYLDNSVANTDGFFTTTIWLNEVNNGILLTKIGDSMKVLFNKVYGANCSVEWTGVSGARGSELKGNNLTGSGGAWALLNAEGVDVASNQCEQPGYLSGYTGIYDSACYIHSCYMINLQDNVINPDNGAATAPTAPGIANNALVIDGTSTGITIGDNNDIQKGKVYHINVGEASVVDTYISDRNRYYGAVPVIADLGTNTTRNLRTSQAYAPPSLATQGATGVNITVSGAKLGMFAQAAFTQNLNGIEMSAWVSAANTVSVQLNNRTGSTMALASGTLNVKVSR